MTGEVDVVPDPRRQFETWRHRRDFGDAVRRLRQDQGLTQEKLAEAAGIDRSYLAGVESGVRNISLDAIVKLANGLAVPPADLFAWPCHD